MKHALLTTPIALGLGALMGATALTPAAAQDMMDREYDFQNEPMAMGDWDQDALAGAWEASELIGEADVYGVDGEEIGEVEDIVVGADDRVRSVVIEAGGFWDIGDTHFAIPFDQVEIQGYDTIRVPLNEDNIDDYDVFNDIDDEAAEGRAWRMSELINDYASLRGGERYGYVDDVLIGQDGSIKAIVVDGTSGYDYSGPYAMPYYGYGYGWGPGYRTYNTGYTQADLENLPVVSEDSISPYWD